MSGPDSTAPSDAPAPADQGDSDKQVLTEFIHARLARADDHLRELQRDVDDLTSNTDRARIGSKLNADATEVYINIYYRPPNPNRRWAVLIGDFAHCLRSALDNAVYAIALTQAESFPPPDDRRLSFPIADNPASWNSVAKAVRSLPEDARSVIKAAQPCFGGHWLLSLLGSLNNMDKHRLPMVATGALTQASVKFNVPFKGELLNVRALNGPAITDAPLVTLTFSEPNPTSNVDIKLATAIFLPYAGAFHEVFETLRETKAQVEAVVDKLQPFVL